jgi:superfamily II DNA or RNA helicase
MTNKIILEQNGRIFPLWIMNNFKKYILPEIIRNEGEDPCDEKITKGLTLYQEFIGQFLKYDSPFKDILVYHGVGSGKTNTAINIYNILYNYNPNWNVFLLIPASLHDDPWIKDLQQWLKKDNYEQRLSNIIFIHYDSPYADKNFLDKIKNADSSKTSIFIIDEVHKFINNVYNNISSKKGKRAQVIYDYIQQEKKENSSTRIILLSATPIVNNPFEFILIFNLLRPDIFPSSEAIFEQIFISLTNYASLNENTKNMFQRRILGLVSYYIGATPDKFAEKTIHYIKIPMEEYHEEVYNYFEEIEEKNDKIRKRFIKGKNANNISTYSAYTRQACNFVFPNISEKVNGESRPRPSKYKIKDAELIDTGEKISKKNSINKTKVYEYIKDINIFINEFIEYLKNILRNETDELLKEDIKIIKNNFNGNFMDYYNSNNIKSKLLLALYNSSPKFINIIFNILNINGTVLVYSNYVEVEGLQLFKIYLNFFGFINLNDDTEININDIDYNKNSKKDNFRYCEFHGKIFREKRKLNKKIFNNSNNKYGKICKIIMISPAGSEGINLRNVRQVHIIEPYWNEVRIEQVIGRALRFCQHQDLPLNERKVDIYRYIMIRKNNNQTTDERIEDIARKKNSLLLSFIDAVKEAAVDCELFKAHNMMGTKYKCFNFNQDALFTNPIGSAFQSKIEYDLKANNGLNSIDSIIKKVKVYKIKAVKELNNKTYSNDNYYWLDYETGIIYDIDLDYPVGKLDKDENDNYILIDDNIYLIKEFIDIPKN